MLKVDSLFLRSGDRSGGVGWFARLGLGWGVGDFIVVFPLDSVWVSWGEFVGAFGGIDALWGLMVNDLWLMRLCQ